MKFHSVLVAVAFLLITGCGTVNTVVRGDAVASRNLKKNNTHCQSIPRVYSGVAYDICTLYGPPPPDYSSDASGRFHTLMFDFFASGLLDTAVLPYTIYRQSKDGNIVIEEWNQTLDLAAPAR